LLVSFPHLLQYMGRRLE
jgi:hypothetical protein